MADTGEAVPQLRVLPDSTTLEEGEYAVFVTVITAGWDVAIFVLTINSAIGAFFGGVCRLCLCSCL